jgi:hypothetical protein
MGKLKIPDSVVLKLEYEISQWQEDDVAYDIADIIVRDEVYDGFTMGYLIRELDAMDESFGDKELLEEFFYRVKRLKEVAEG